ncbi:MAG: efflux RND transporter permease subunit, partial [Bacteroidetes bacterium]
LVINPVLAASFMKVSASVPNKRRSWINAGISAGIGLIFILLGAIALGNILVVLGMLIILNYYVLYPGAERFQNGFLPKLESFYERFLTKALNGNGPLRYFLGTVGLLIFSFVLMFIFPPKVDFFPVNEPNYVNIFISHPVGTDITVTNETTLKIEEKLNAILSPYLESDKAINDPKKKLIRSIISQVGEGTSDPQAGVAMGNTPHKGRITVNFTEFQHRNGVKTSDVLKSIQNGLRGQFTADIEITVAKEENGPPQGPPVNIEVSGKREYKDLIVEAGKIKAYLDKQGIPGVEELKLNVEANRPEIPIHVDRDQLRKLNASTYQVGMAIRKALLGQDIAVYTQDEESYDIVVKFEKRSREDLDALLDQRLIFRNNKGQLMNIPIRSVIKDPKEVSSFTGVVRKDQIPLVTVSSNIIEGFNANEVVQDVKAQMEKYESSGKLDDSISYAFTGQQEEQAKEMAFLSNALLIAVFLILLIIVAQFNSYSMPSVIMITVILSLIGVLLGLVISRQNFVIMMTMIGVISLAGVVVNNAIVLIDYTNQLRKERRQRKQLGEYDQLEYDEIVEAAIEAGKTRLRPVLLTAITTVLGLIPLAVGFNIDFLTLFTEYDANIYIGGDNNIFFAPLSWAIIYGLTFATFLTLVIIPSLYLLMYRLKVWIYKKANWKLRSNI